MKMTQIIIDGDEFDSKDDNEFIGNIMHIVAWKISGYFREEGLFWK